MDGGVQAGGAILGRHDRLDTHGIRHTQAGPEIVGILYTVEHEQECGFGKIFQHFVQRRRQRGFLYEGGNSLVPPALGKSVQAFRIGFVQPYTCGFRQIRHTARTRVGSPRIQKHFEYFCRPAFQCCCHGM
jgi:hypothetical protein